MRLRIFLGLLALAAAWKTSAASICFVYAGTYTDWELFGPPRRNPPGPRSKGIYVFRFDPENGKLTPLGVAAETDNPTYVTFAPSGKYLYAVNEIYRSANADTGTVSAFAIDAPTGRLTLLNRVASHGTGPCHAVVDATGRNLLVANFGSGSAAVFPLQADGRLREASAKVQDTGSGPNPRQATPHSHAINLTPDNRFALVSQFGTDRLAVFRFDAERGLLQPADAPYVPLGPGAAPRHLAFHRNGRFAYSLNEIDSTITVLGYDARSGAFTNLQTISTLPAGYTGRNTAAEIIVHPSGKFLYASNRGHNSIAVFAIATDGRLGAATQVPCGGRTPRGCSVDPSGRWLITANQDTHNLAVFALDPATGMPTPTGQSENVRMAVCVKFLVLPE